MEAFQWYIINMMETTSATTLILQCTLNRLVDYQGDALLHAFPLQFPYGYGLPPIEQKRGRDSGHDVAMSNMEYLQHLQYQNKVTLMEMSDRLVLQMLQIFHI